MFDILICQKLAECDSDALIKVNLSPGMGCGNNINLSVHKYVGENIILQSFVCAGGWWWICDQRRTNAYPRIPLHEYAIGNLTHLLF